MRGSSSRESSKSRLPAERFATSSSWDNRAHYESYKHQLGKTLLLGLEFLVAADVVRTVALEPTLTNVAVLGLLVVIRTFLSWSLKRMAAQAEADRKAAEEDCPFGKPDLLPKEKFKGRRWRQS